MALESGHENRCAIPHLPSPTTFCPVPVHEIYGSEVCYSTVLATNLEPQCIILWARIDHERCIQIVLIAFDQIIKNKVVFGHLDSPF